MYGRVSAHSRIAEQDEPVGAWPHRPGGSFVPSAVEGSPRPDTLPPDAGPSPRQRARNRRILAVAVIVVFLSVTSAIFFTPLGSALFRPQCGPGPILESRTLMTPLIIVDSPFLGSANGTASWQGGYATTGLIFNGSSEAIVGLWTWTVRSSAVLHSVGTRPRCSQTYFVSDVPSTAGTSTTCSLLGAGSPSDVGVPPTLPTSCEGGQASPWLRFDAAFNASQPSNGGVGGGVSVLDTPVSGFPVEVPLNTSHGTVWIAGSVPSTWTWGYTLPTSGCWQIQSLPSGNYAWGGHTASGC
jgi:hypothetical protein